MHIAYLDCVGGISGDMFLGALIAAGVDSARLRSELAKLNLSGWSLATTDVRKAGVAAVKADVVVAETPRERTFPEIKKMIEDGGLPDAIKAKAVRVFEILAEAEAAVHGTTASTVHFHEVGAVDAIIDICGAVCCLAELGIDKIYVSPLTVSRPAPATLEILKGRRFKITDLGLENVTPTGASILAALAEWSAPPEITLTGIGCGAGQTDTAKPNVLRVLIGSTKPGAEAADEVALIETNVDDMTPEQLAYCLETLLSGGALDVWFTPIVMKKGRPAFTVSCLGPPELAGTLTEIMFRETGTLGLRLSTVSRQVLARETTVVQTEYGDIRVKVGKMGGASVSVRPEYEDCAAAAKMSGQPLREVYNAALKGPARS